MKFVLRKLVLVRSEFLILNRLTMKCSYFLSFRDPCIASILLLIYFQQDATLHSLLISGKLLYMPRVVSPPITRSTNNCIYSKLSGTSQTVTATCRYYGRVGTRLNVVWELYWSVLVRLLTYVRKRTKTVQYNSHTTLKPVPTLPQ